MQQQRITDDLELMINVLHRALPKPCGWQTG